MLRDLRPVKTRHSHCKFTIPEEADFAIQREVARVGQVHHDFTTSPNFHYFVQGAVENIMKALNFASVAGDTAGNPSISKAEFVHLYSRWNAASVHSSG